MSFEDIQNAWKQQAPVGRIEVESATLMKLVKRDQKTLQKTLFRHDILEVGTALILVPIWIWLDQSQRWTWHLVIPGCLWIASFLIFDRYLQRQKTPAESDPLKKSIESASPRERRASAVARMSSYRARTQDSPTCDDVPGTPRFSRRTFEQLPSPHTGLAYM